MPGGPDCASQWLVAFAFEADEPFDEGVRRVVHKQVTKAIASLERDDDLRAVVHGARKHGKRVRAVLRLVRDDLGDGYRSADVAVRDAGRLLAPVRDAHALLGTFDALVAGSVGERNGQGLLGVRAGLALRAHAASVTVEPGDPVVAEAIALLGSVRDQVETWALDDGFGAISPGLRTTYRQGRHRFQAADEHPGPKIRHEWRKATKYLWHQTQLLAPAAPSLLEPAADALHALADTLGDDHDLHGLRRLVRSDPDAFGGAAEVDAAVALADGRRVDLQHRAVVLGARLYAEKPKAFVDRLGRYVDVWHTSGDELPAGEIASIAPPEDGLEGLTRSELYARARAADVPGRSQMGRDDLLGSLRALAP